MEPKTSEISFKDIKKDAKRIKESIILGSQEALQYQNAELAARRTAIELYAQEQFLKLQETWANHIKWQIWAVLGFQLLFVVMVGFNVYGFTDNINKLPYMYIGVILQSLANIIALGLVVARFLFPKNTT